MLADFQFHFQLDSKCPCGIQYARHRIEIESQIFYRAPPPTSDCMRVKILILRCFPTKIDTHTHVNGGLGGWEEYN